MLDLKGILRDSVVTKKKRVLEREENEVDEFYDRTGTIQRKRAVSSLITAVIICSLPYACILSIETYVERWPFKRRAQIIETAVLYKITQLQYGLLCSHSNPLSYL